MTQTVLESQCDAAMLSVQLWPPKYTCNALHFWQNINHDHKVTTSIFSPSLGLWLCLHKAYLLSTNHWFLQLPSFSEQFWLFVVSSLKVRVNWRCPAAKERQELPIHLFVGESLQHSQGHRQQWFHKSSETTNWPCTGCSFKQHFTLSLFLDFLPTYQSQNRTE